MCKTEGTTREEVPFSHGTAAPNVVLCNVVPASFLRAVRRLAAAALALVSGGASAVPAGHAVSRHVDSAPVVVLNVRDFGAIGDGRVHRVSEWIEQRRFGSLRALRRAYPFVDDARWSIDEVAFELAKRALPPEGGTIHFPAGHYVTGRHSWRIWRDHVRLTGEGADRTLLSTAPEIEDGLSLAPYRHIGWKEGASDEYAFTAGSGQRGTSEMKLRLASAAADFSPGELVFIRNGANRFDQDYGEFNVVAGAEPDGTLRFEHPFGRDYTLAKVNWAGEVAEDFALPRPRGTVRIALRRGEGFFVPPRGAVVSIGENLFRVEQQKGAEIRLANLGRANEPRGTLIRAGAKVAKSRSVIKLTRSTRNFRAEGLQVIGRRKAVSISNSYDVSFADCTFVRDLRDGAFRGGLTLDGDGGRFARFERCTFIATPAIGMQMARSFGGIVFSGCTFKNTNVAFTEFNFDAEVSNCTFEVQGTRALGHVIIAGKSCGDLRFFNNRITASGVTAIFDTVMDIHSQKHGSEGDVIVRDNTITVSPGVRVWPVPRPARFLASENRVITK